MSFFEVNVATCAKCKGCAYQTFPLPYAGLNHSKWIIIGQNPGEIKSTDDKRKILFDHSTSRLWSSVLDDKDRANIIWSSYEQDFITSSAYRIMEKVFGENWLQKWCFTNAVRCRTPGNHTPTAEMVNNCADYTATLLHGKEAVVMMGRVAEAQVAEIVGGNFEPLHPVVNKHTGVSYLSIPHFARWPYMNADQIREIKEGVYKITREK